MTDKELLQQALDVLNYVYEGAQNQGPFTGISWNNVENKTAPMIETIKAKLAQPEPEPVAFYVYKPALPRCNLMHRVTDNALPWVYDQDPSSGYEARMLVYTAPSKKELVGLTDEEITEVWVRPHDTHLTTYQYFARAIEAKLKEKNNG